MELLLYFVLCLSAIFAIFIVYTRFFNKPIVKKDKKPVRSSYVVPKIDNVEPKPIKQIEPIFYYEQSAVKYSFFDTFYGQARDIYKYIIVDTLYIDEPFHTLFAQLLIFWKNNDDWIKSKKSKTITILVDGKKSKSFKVYSKQELVFYTVIKSFRYLQKENISKKNIQNTLIAILLFYIYDEKIINSFLANYEDSNIILVMLSLVNDHNKDFDFIHNIFEQSKGYAEAYPYTDDEDSQKDSIKYLPNDIDIEKKLLSQDQF